MVRLLKYAGIASCAVVHITPLTIWTYCRQSLTKLASVTKLIGIYWFASFVYIAFLVLLIADNRQAFLKFTCKL